MNVKIKSVRRVARGFRNTDNYRTRILLHAGQPRRVPTTARIRSYSFATAARPTSVGKTPIPAASSITTQ
jgi:hypothetical protein